MNHDCEARIIYVTTKPVGVLSQIGCEPGMLVTKTVTKGQTVVTKSDPTTLHHNMYLPRL